MKKVLPFIIFSFIFIRLTSQTDAGNGWVKEDNSIYSITYPQDWRYDDSGDMGAIFTIYSPYTDQEDNYNDYIQLNALPVNGLNMTLDKHVESVLKDIPFFYNKSEVTLNRKDTKNGISFVVLAYHGLFNDFPISFHQYIWIIDEKVYTLNFAGKPEGVDLLLPQALLIMDSFSFKK